jgi:hypothetical protein
MSKAYQVRDKMGEPLCMVIAEDAIKAKSKAMKDSSTDFYFYIDLRATRIYIDVTGIEGDFISCLEATKRGYICFSYCEECKNCKDNKECEEYATTDFIKN